MPSFNSDLCATQELKNINNSLFSSFVANYKLHRDTVID